MKEILIRAGDDPARDKLLEALSGKVFHLTSEEAFAGIAAEGRVGHNRSARYPLSRGSGKSFGRLHGYVCLYDLRDVSPRRLSNTRRLCDFLQPEWHSGGGRNPVYLLLRPESLTCLVPNAAAFYLCRATGQSLRYLPGVECWYPGDLPLEKVAEVLRFIG